MLESITYFDAFHRDAAALVVAAGCGLEGPVPSCPGWTVATLLTHLTGLYAYSVKLVEGRPREADALVTRCEDLDLPLELKNWFNEEKMRLPCQTEEETSDMVSNPYLQPRSSRASLRQRHPGG